ncbi:LOW QUALITY PROTEIN: hypothetical protein V2J09_013310 [Rumex salicifolius]
MKNNIFGPVAARVQVVEFQKHGLPHTHILLILKVKHKILNPDAFDRYVCAELPSTENPYLRALVMKHMIHGPLWKSKSRLCLHERRKSSMYPQNQIPKTLCRVYYMRGATLDNRWVIPYNAFLHATFDCHINFEIFSTTEAVKYLYKYVYKGHDRVSFNISQNDHYKEDEITSYPKHLPQLHLITFNEYENLQNVVDNEDRLTTLLMLFFNTTKIIRKTFLIYTMNFICTICGIIPGPQGKYQDQWEYLHMRISILSKASLNAY